FAALVGEHAAFLTDEGVSAEGLRAVDPEAVRHSVEGDMETQMQHNISEGLLQPADEGHGRYSWRGMLYLWFQFLRDIFRFS
ncbi:MAG: hypothetical protein RIR25_796, partial [Verrucomicrobiota bacterium]